MTRYRFGSLVLDSDMPLPGFDHRRADDDHAPVRFRFTLGAGAEPFADTGRVVLAGRGRRLLTVRRQPDRAYRLAVPDAAPVTLLPDHRTLRCPRTPTAHDAEFLVGMVLPRVATMQDGLVLHAATLAAPGGAVLLCGRSGAGKSTLASAVAAATGWPLLGDDAVALESGPDAVLAHPFNPDIRLLDGSVKRRHPVVGGGQVRFRPGSSSGAERTGTSAAASRRPRGRQPHGVAPQPSTAGPLRHRAGCA